MTGMALGARAVWAVLRRASRFRVALLAFVLLLPLLVTALFGSR
jgi:hypothetical protein